MASEQEVRVPEIGDFNNVPIIQILVAAGDRIKVNDPLVVLESDKATIDVPSPFEGTVRDVKAVLGDRVSAGALLLTLQAADQMAPPRPATASSPEVAAAATSVAVVEKFSKPEPLPEVMVSAPLVASTRVRAGPAVRSLARRLGVDLTKLQGTGNSQRIRPEDVHGFVKTQLTEARPVSIVKELPSGPKIDFAKYGPVERRALTRIQTISGARLSANWTRIPHVTNFDEADITDVDAFRVELNREEIAGGLKLSVLPFIIKACAHVLLKHPRLNASLDGEELVYKNYVHIGFAADTPDGLLVPVIRDADKKGIREIAREAAQLAQKARERLIKPMEMEGGCFTISSLGGIGGNGFTPIINAPEAAILGAGKAKLRPIWDGNGFVPRLILPLALSWDHRIVDGALAARFLVDLVNMLRDIKRLVL